MTRLTGGTIVGAVALLLAGFSGTANAQARGYLQLGGGVSIPVGDFKDAGAKTGWLGQVAGGITAPGGVLGGRISGSYIRHGVELSDEHLRIVGAMADLTVSPKMTGKLAPYVLAGVGFQNGKSSLAGSEGSTKFAWNAGAGLSARAGSVGVFVEGRFLSIRTEGSSTNVIPITVGIRLGGH